MPRAVFVVFTNPASPDQEDEYNEFYDSTHLPEVCQTPGFVSGRATGCRTPVSRWGQPVTTGTSPSTKSSRMT